MNKNTTQIPLTKKDASGLQNNLLWIGSKTIKMQEELRHQRANYKVCCQGLVGVLSVVAVLF